MANIQSNAARPAVDGSGPGYSLPNKAVPLPRQWQLPPPQLSVPRNQVALQHFYPGPAGSGNQRQAMPSRGLGRAILLTLWLLILLAAIAIGMRMFDLTTIAAPPAEPPARPSVPASAADAVNAANAMRSAALATARPDDSDPFDDIAPMPSPPPLPLPKLLPTPSTRLTPAATLAIERPAAPRPVAVARPASRDPVCADAIRAMQLCPE